MEMSSCPISPEHRGSSLDGFGMSVGLPPHEKGNTWESLPFLWLALQNRCWESCRKESGLQASASGKDAPSCLWWLHKSGLCSLPAQKSAYITDHPTWFGEHGKPSCISTRVWFRLLLLKSFFSLSFPSYLATRPTGTILMQENRLDDTF